MSPPMVPMARGGAINVLHLSDLVADFARASIKTFLRQRREVFSVAATATALNAFSGKRRFFCGLRQDRAGFLPNRETCSAP